MENNYNIYVKNLEKYVSVDEIRKILIDMNKYLNEKQEQILYTEDDLENMINEKNIPDFFIETIYYFKDFKDFQKIDN